MYLFQILLKIILPISELMIVQCENYSFKHIGLVTTLYDFAHIYTDIDGALSMPKNSNTRMSHTNYAK